MTLPIAAQLLLSGLSLGSIYALVALALVIPFKASGVLNFGQGETVTLGAYVALTISTLTALPYWVVVPATLAIAALAGILIERIFIRPLVRAPEFTIVIATFALGLLIKDAIRIRWEDQVYSLSVPFSTRPWLFGTLRVNPVFVWMIACAFVIMILLVLFFRFNKTGKAMRAVSQNQDGARLMGIGVERVYASTWAISTAMGALVGILLAPVTGIEPEMGGIILKAFVAAVIGGFSSLPGAVFGGLALGVIETFSGALVSNALKQLVAFALLIVFLMVRPYGLFGAPEARRV